MASITRKNFASAVLVAGGWPNTEQNLIGLVAWSIAEGSNASFNALDTTEPEADTTDFNSAGVKDYPTLAEGVTATVATLKNGLYVNVTDALERGNSAVTLANSVADSPWGTESFGNIVAEVSANPTDYFNQVFDWPDTANFVATSETETADVTSQTETEIKTLDEQVTSMGKALFISPTLSGKGYHLCTESGAIFALGDANYFGGANVEYEGEAPLLPGERVTSFIGVNGGYFMATNIGGVRAYGKAKYLGNAVEGVAKPA